MATTSDLISLARELGESVEGQPENVTEALPRLGALLAGQSEAHVVIETVTALGQARDQRAAQVILDHVGVTHPNAGSGAPLHNLCPTASRTTPLAETPWSRHSSS